MAKSAANKSKQARVLSSLARGEQVPAVDLHQRDMLRLATIDGARVWHLEDEIGTLTPGKQAAKPSRASCSNASIAMRHSL